jgi:competence protein ComEC
MINLNGTDLQADAHLLEFPLGKRVLIDVGHQDDRLAKYLKAKSISEIDLVLISHPHKDHYGGLPFLLDAGIRLKEVRFNMPIRSVCDREVPWGCDFRHVAETHQALAEKGSPAKPYRPSEIWEFPETKASIEVLYAYDGVNTPIGVTDINDTSVLLKLTVGTTRVLFTGDLNQPMGDYLAVQAKNLQADILKVPHHGTAGLAPNRFFDAVGPRLAMVPSPRRLWLSDRSKQARTYFTEKKIPTFINGFHGHVEVLLRPESPFVINAEFGGL